LFHSRIAAGAVEQEDRLAGVVDDRAVLLLAAAQPPLVGLALRAG
jgi:hypothetical protein